METGGLTAQRPAEPAVGLVVGVAVFLTVCLTRLPGVSWGGRLQESRTQLICGLGPIFQEALQRDRRQAPGRKRIQSPATAHYAGSPALQLSYQKKTGQALCGPGPKPHSPQSHPQPPQASSAPAGKALRGDALHGRMLRVQVSGNVHLVQGSKLLDRHWGRLISPPTRSAGPHMAGLWPEQPSCSSYTKIFSTSDVSNQEGESLGATILGTSRSKCQHLFPPVPPTAVYRTGGKG